MKFSTLLFIGNSFKIMLLPSRRLESIRAYAGMTKCSSLKLNGRKFVVPLYAGPNE